MPTRLIKNDFVNGESQFATVNQRTGFLKTDKLIQLSIGLQQLMKPVGVKHTQYTLSDPSLGTIHLRRRQIFHDF